MTASGHLEVLRGVIFRVLGVVVVLAIALFCLKGEVFAIIFAPKQPDFITWRAINNLLGGLGLGAGAIPEVSLINTELTAQFMVHLQVSFILALLLASPYILFELFRFVAPALYANEKRYSKIVLIAVYLLFAAGVVMSYFILFPVAFRFLGGYQVDASVENTITLDSYISTFCMLTILCALMFQLPIVIYTLGRMGLVTSATLRHYRPHALVAVMLVAAFITPPDIFTLILVSFPVFGLYELGLRLIR